jgi:tyrosinase
VAGTPPPPSSTLRKDLNTLSGAEWNRFVQAVLVVKANGVYDGFTKRHMEAMLDATLYPGETGTGRCVAHRGPAFYPWHRQALGEFERELQKVDTASPPLSIPYWRWDAEITNWQSATIWTLVGGNGDPAQGWRVVTGPFSDCTSVIWDSSAQTFVSRAGILRNFGANP